VTATLMKMPATHNSSSSIYCQTLNFTNYP